MEWLLIVAAIFVVWLAFGAKSLPHKKQSANSKPRNPRAAVITPDKIFHWPGTGNFDFEVVGESFYQGALMSLASRQAEDGQVWLARIIPEHNNPHDELAVMVEIEGSLVGYIPSDDARSFRRRLGARKLTNQVTTCDAIIIGGGTRRNGEKLLYGVALDMKTF